MKKILPLVLLVFLTATISAQYTYSLENGIVVEELFGLPTGRRILTAPETWYIRWDGQIRPRSELNIETNNWPYKIDEYDSYYLLTRRAKTLQIPKRAWLFWTFGERKITLEFAATFEQLLERAEIYTSECRYLDFGNADRWTEIYNVLWADTEFGWDDNFDLYYTGEFQYENGTNYEQTVYFDKNNADFIIHNSHLYLLLCDNQFFLGGRDYPFHFSFHSFVINSTGGDFVWSEMSLTNLTEFQADGSIRLQKETLPFYDYYSMDNSYADENTTQANDGTPTNGGFASGVYGYSWVADGNDGINIGTLDSFGSSLEDFTICYWANWTYSAGQMQTIYTNGGVDIIIAHNLDYGTAADAGELYFQVTDVDGKHLKFGTNNRELNNGVFHHLCFVVSDASANTAALYVDGRNMLDGYGAQQSPSNWANLDGNLFIGRLDAVQFRGNLDEVYFYTYALTPQQVNQTRDNTHRGHGVSNSPDLVAGGDVLGNITLIFQNTNISAGVNGTELCNPCVNGTAYDAFATNYADIIQLNFSTLNTTITPQLYSITYTTITTTSTTTTTPATTTTTLIGSIIVFGDTSALVPCYLGDKCTVKTEIFTNTTPLTRRDNEPCHIFATNSSGGVVWNFDDTQFINPAGTFIDADDVEKYYFNVPLSNTYGQYVFEFDVRPDVFEYNKTYIFNLVCGGNLTTVNLTFLPQRPPDTARIKASAQAFSGFLVAAAVALSILWYVLFKVMGVTIKTFLKLIGYGVVVLALVFIAINLTSAESALILDVSITQPCYMGHYCTIKAQAIDNDTGLPYDDDEVGLWIEDVNGSVVIDYDTMLEISTMSYTDDDGNVIAVGKPLTDSQGFIVYNMFMDSSKLFSDEQYTAVISIKSNQSKTNFTLSPFMPPDVERQKVRFGAFPVFLLAGAAAFLIIRAKT